MILEKVIKEYRLIKGSTVKWGYFRFVGLNNRGRKIEVIVERKLGQLYLYDQKHKC